MLLGYKLVILLSQIMTSGLLVLLECGWAWGGVVVEALRY